MNCLRTDMLKGKFTTFGPFTAMLLLMTTSLALANEIKQCGFSTLKLAGKTLSPRGNYEISYNHPQNDSPSLVISNMKTGQSCESYSAIERGMFISLDEKRLLAIWADEMENHIDL